MAMGALIHTIRETVLKAMSGSEDALQLALYSGHDTTYSTSIRVPRIHSLN